MFWFRIGSVILIVTAFIHLIGHFTGMTASNETERQLLGLMEGHILQPIGKTMMDLWKGFSLFYALFFLMTGELNLWLARAFRNNPSELKKVAVVNIIGLGIGTAVSFCYFFYAPILCIMLALICFIIALFTIKVPAPSA